jgi:hypothetical protein
MKTVFLIALLPLVILLTGCENEESGPSLTSNQQTGETRDLQQAAKGPSEGDDADARQAGGTVDRADHSASESGDQFLAQFDRRAVGAEDKARNVTAIEKEIDKIAACTKERVRLEPTWPWAPPQTEAETFSAFKKYNESRWNLETDTSKIPPGTVYVQTTPTDEGNHKRVFGLWR